MQFEFTIDEVNGILAVLGKQPFEAVAPLIDNIRQQAVPQLPIPPAVEADKDAE